MNRDHQTTVSDVPTDAPTDSSPRLAPELCSHLGFVLGQARQELVTRMDRITEAHGLTIRHFGALVLISRRGAMRQTELADAIRIDRTTAMNLVDDLEKRQFVRREADPSDRRANAVTATPEGLAWLEDIRPDAQAAEAAFLSPLSAAEQDTLRELLTRLVMEPTHD